MVPRASDNQSGCIISNEEMEMALQRMMREQFGNAEPPTSSWQKLRGSIIAAQPIDAHQEVLPRLISVKLAWVNLFVPRMLQTALAVVILLATVLTNGANLGDLMLHQSTGYVQPAPASNQRLDDRTQDPPMIKTLPNVSQPSDQAPTDQPQQASNGVNEYEHVNTEFRPVEVSYENAQLRVGDYYVH